MWGTLPSFEKRKSAIKKRKKNSFSLPSWCFLSFDCYRFFHSSFLLFLVQSNGLQLPQVPRLFFPFLIFERRTRFSGLFYSSFFLLMLFFQDWLFYNATNPSQHRTPFVVMIKEKLLMPTVILNSPFSLSRLIVENTLKKTLKIKRADYVLLEKFWRWGAIEYKNTNERTGEDQLVNKRFYVVAPTKPVKRETRLCLQLLDFPSINQKENGNKRLYRFIALLRDDVNYALHL